MNFKNLYDNPEDSDIIIKVGDKNIYAHKIILKHASPVLKAGLSGVFKETDEGCFEMVDHTPAAVKTALKYAYGFTISCYGMNAIEYFDTLATANYLEMKPLLNDIIMGPIPDDAELVHIIQCAYLYDSEDLMKRAVMICEKNIKKEGIVKTTENFAELGVNEYKLFREKWINYKPMHLLCALDCYYSDINADSEVEKTNMLALFIPDIRFHEIHPDALKTLFNAPIIKNSDVIKHLLESIHKVKTSNLNRIHARDAEYREKECSMLILTRDANELLNNDNDDIDAAISRI
jgi:hypothetical protein